MPRQQFGATVFPSFGSLNLSYGMIFLPGTGILAAYVDPATGKLGPDFQKALAFYLFAWFALAVIFTVSAIRSSLVLLADFLALDLALLLLACGYLVGNDQLVTAGSSVAFVVVALSCKYFFACSDERLG